jgi:hypothetical protein
MRTFLPLETDEVSSPKAKNGTSSRKTQTSIPGRSTLSGVKLPCIGATPNQEQDENHEKSAEPKTIALQNLKTWIHST